MTATSTDTISARLQVVVQDDAQEPAVAILAQWLRQRSHRVRHASTCGAAIADAVTDEADLLVLSLPDHEAQVDAIDRLALLPSSQRPKQIAILADEEPDVTLRRRLPGTRLHLLGQPIHLLGLLEIAKRITNG